MVDFGIFSLGRTICKQFYEVYSSFTIYHYYFHFNLYLCKISFIYLKHRLNGNEIEMFLYCISDCLRNYRFIFTNFNIYFHKN